MLKLYQYLTKEQKLNLNAGKWKRQEIRKELDIYNNRINRINKLIHKYGTIPDKNALPLLKFPYSTEEVISYISELAELIGYTIEINMPK